MASYKKVQEISLSSRRFVHGDVPMFRSFAHAQHCRILRCPLQKNTFLNLAYDDATEGKRF